MSVNKMRIFILTIILIPASFIAGGALNIAFYGGVRVNYSNPHSVFKMSDAPRKRTTRHSSMGFKYYLKKLRGSKKDDR